ncbi:MAG: redoxin domain-containing protein [Planctomycetes bacterium]|nr:redoxin domain-containing protein [Planctomycetota bacterium]
MARFTQVGSAVALVALAAALVGFGGAGSTWAADPAVSTDRLNKEIENVTFTDAAGKASSLRDHAGKTATVVVFLSFDCPVSNSYAATLADLHKKYGDKGVGFLAVVPTDDDAAKVAKKAAEFKLPFPAFSDSKLAAAEAFKAVVTPEAFVLDHNRVLRYRGRIDNAYSGRLKKNPQVTEHDLAAALAAVVAGKDVAAPATRAIGCHIDPKERKVTSEDVTYHRDVAPILQKHCQSCHRPGDVGPFALTTYRQAVNWASDIVHYTQSKEMPPWKPAGGVEFSNARALTIKELDTLVAWEKAGCPEGDPKDAPPPLKFASGWRFGEPDLVLEVPEDFHVGAAGKDEFRVFVLPANLKEDKYVVAYEVKPGNASVVHHTLNYFDATGTARKLEEKEKARAKKPDEQDKGPGYSVAMGIGFLPQLVKAPRPDVPPVGGLGGWAPGQLGVRYPEGSGTLLPKESDILLQVHYHRTGKPEKDRTKIGLYFAKGPVGKPWNTLVITGMSPISFIPAGKADHKEKGSGWLTGDATVYSVMPHMHLLGKSVKITMTPPDGAPQVLVDIDRWDYNWQETYWLAKPIAAKAGTRFDIEAVFDNSAKNPNNPSVPPKLVTFGEETTNEMLFGFLGAVPAGKERVRLLREPPAPKK